jgi:hypothetical protein
MIQCLQNKKVTIKYQESSSESERNQPTPDQQGICSDASRQITL